MRQRYLVVVYRPAPRHAGGNSSISVADLPTVQWLNALTAQEAAAAANVPPGGRAEVAAKADVVTFTRAEMAPLVSDQPQVGVAA